jgi:inner membrane transporter RhtA
MRVLRLPAGHAAAGGNAFALHAPPELFFLITATAQALGPALGVTLFTQTNPLGVAWMRIATAAVCFCVWRRPWRDVDRLRRSFRHLALLGTVLALMNSSFYLALHQLPLGVVGTIEFIPVTVIAALNCRSARNLIVLAASIAGALLLTGAELGPDPLGLALATANALLFAAYIALTARVARAGHRLGIDGLACAMTVALLVATPIGGWSVLSRLDSPRVLAGGVAIGLLSSVIGYVGDQLALARISPGTYALLFPLLPATTTAVGFLVLGQALSATEVTGIAMIITAIALRQRSPCS